jgi:hypothetical protein
MIVSDLSAFALDCSAIIALIDRKHGKVIMNLLLFVLEIFPIVAGIALVPSQSELRISRARAIDDERDQKNSLRS